MSALNSSRDEAYDALNRFFKDLYFINQDWFKVRSTLNIKQTSELFDTILEEKSISLFRSIDDLRVKLAKIKTSAGQE